MNYRKVARPFDSKKLTHAVLKAHVGLALRFTKSQQSIRTLIGEAADKYSVKVRDLAINHDHIHLLFSARDREDQVCFLRFLAAEMGRQYRALKKKYGIRSSGSIWIQRPFTRLVSWSRRSLQNVQRYFEKNRGEAIGFIKYQPRQHHLSRFLSQWAENQRLDSA